MSNKRIKVGSLEFDEIKQNLKEFFKGQEQFSDYDFEGSNLSILLDVLAYNTYYNNVYTNMAVNESFLDSASKRSSVVSRATELGYVPRSAICARTKVNFVLAGAVETGQFLTIPRLTPFTGTKNGIKYTFYTAAAVTAARNADFNFEFTDVAIWEGMNVTNRFVYTDANSFIIPNKNVDLTTMTVRVQTTNTLYDTYTSVTTLSDVTGTSKVYFLREVEGGYYELSFGDDIIGKKLANGNIINIDYFISSGEGPNGITNIAYAGQNISGGSIENLIIQSPINGGREPESIEEIRFNAPNFYATQNRIVTALDYETLILNKVPSIEAVSVWGGENNYPPIYGKVFISAKTLTGKNLTYTEQQDIISSVIEPYKMVSVIPEFVQPEYIDVELDLVAYYDQSMTSRTPEDIKTAITSELLYFNNNELQKFNRIMRQSVVSRLVEEVDSAIISCVPRMKMYRSLTPIYYVDTTYFINIGNPFTPKTIASTAFYISNFTNACYIDDDGLGNLTLYSLINGIRYDLRNTGSVDYDNGTMTINNLNIVRLSGGVFKLSITPKSSDIISIFNQIVQLDVAKLKVSLIADETTNGRILKGNKFQFTSSSI